jgi:hypothetical protein
MMYDSDDALDRALFALPLEEPPAGLRASILTATAYRPAPAFTMWEAVFIGTVTAVMAWLVALIVLGGGPLFVSTVTAIAFTGARAISNTGNLAWLAAGGATAFWLTFFTGSQPFAFVSQRFERKSGR